MDRGDTVQERFFQMAGLRFRVLGEQFAQSQGLLAEFCAPKGDWDAEYTLETVDQLSQPEGELCFQDAGNCIFRTADGVIRYKGALKQSLEGAYIRIFRRGNTGLVQIKRSSIPQGITSKVIVSCLEIVHHLTAAGGFLLHASWIDVGGEAILFTGPSGIGKSTQAALWQRHRQAELINGDRAAVFPGREGVEVRGIPFCGSSGVTQNRTLPLKAVVYLSQAPQTDITPLTGGKAFRRLWPECCINVWNPEDIASCTQSLSQTLMQVPVFHLSCTPDGSAVQALEKMIKDMD
jgi:hypothetical protein